MHWGIPDPRDDLPCPDQRTDGDDVSAFVRDKLHRTGARRMDDPLSRIARDHTRHTRVRDRRSLPDHAPQLVPAHGLDHRVYILPGGKPRSETDRDGRHLPACSQIALGQNRVHHRGGLQRGNACRIFIHQQRDLPQLRSLFRLRRIRNAARRYTLNLRRALPDCLAQRGLAADGRGVGALGHRDLESAPVQPHDHAGRKITRTAHQHPRLIVLQFHRLSSSAHSKNPAKCSRASRSSISCASLSNAR